MSTENIVQLCDLCGEAYFGPDLGSNLERVCPDCITEKSTKED